MKYKRNTSKSSLLTRGVGKPQFLYRQLAGLLRADIDAGHLKPGDMLPSMDEISRIHRINKATVRQAIAELAAEGRVFSVPAKGTFVAEPAKARNGNGARALAVGWISAVSDQGQTGRFHTEMMDAVRAAVQDLGGHLMVFSASDTSPSNLCRSVREAGLDGAILVGPAQQEPLRSLVTSPLPTVLVEDRFRGQPVDSIITDNEGGGFQAVSHLAGLGHRRIALVTGPQSWQVTKERMAGALAAAEAAQIPVADIVVIESNFAPVGGIESIRELIRRDPSPTGVFFFNDEMAAGALQALHGETSLRVPADLSIVGFDDVLWASLSHPPLTTIHVEKELMGRQAVERLHAIIRSTNGHIPTATVVPTRLVERKSTAQPSRKG